MMLDADTSISQSLSALIVSASISTIPQKYTFPSDHYYNIRIARDYHDTGIDRSNVDSIAISDRDRDRDREMFSGGVETGASPEDPMKRNGSNPDFRSTIIGDIRSFSDLKPGWDGYGGKPPSQQAIDDAIAFLGLLPFDCPEPTVLPAGDGEIGFVWDIADAYIDVGFLGDRVLSYFARVGRDSAEVFGDVPFSGRGIPRDLISAIEQLPRTV